jgi:hypothetical protein
MRRAKLAELHAAASGLVQALHELHAAASGLVQALHDERERRSLGAAQPTRRKAVERGMLDGLPAGSQAGTVPAATVDVADEDREIQETDVMYLAAPWDDTSSDPESGG